jgi:hypothetical protein
MSFLAGSKKDYVMVTGRHPEAEGAAGVGMVTFVDPELQGLDPEIFHHAEALLPAAARGFDVASFLQGLGYRVLEHEWSTDLLVMLPPGFARDREEAALAASSKGQ